MRLRISMSALAVLGLTITAPGATSGDSPPLEWKAGVAAIDVTPAYPVRLSGYGSRTAEHEGVQLKIWAKALALKWQEESPTVLVTVDNCGVPAHIRNEVLKRLATDGNPIEADRLAIHSSHTHCAPMLRGVLPFLFGKDLPPEEQEHVDRYTEDLTRKIVSVIEAALGKFEPSKLKWGLGEVAFAGNRRFKTPTGIINSPNPYGPVDHALPVLVVQNAEGKTSAIFTSYACHCTTLSTNRIHGDWAGRAQQEMQLRFPGAIALTAIGCGGDQNPYPRKDDGLARLHGIALANAAANVIRNKKDGLRDIHGPLRCATTEIRLPYSQLPEREEWQKRTQDKNRHTAYHATQFLAMLDKGESIPVDLPYLVQTWSFADDMLMVNLPGEVVVDYGLRLKKEFDPSRTWVNGYTNDVPCYIPSQRVWEEGGYEGGDAMIYYGRPARFASGIEDRIIQAVHSIAPDGFAARTGNESPCKPCVK